MPLCPLCSLPAVGLILGFSLAAAAASPKHPLDPLDADEIRAAVAILRSDGRLTLDSRFVMLTAQEPPKSQVTAGPLWRYSDLQHNVAETRRARELVVSSIMNAGN